MSINVFLIFNFLTISNCWLANPFFKDFIYLFLEKGEGREKKRERNLSASRMPPTGDQPHNPGMCPDWDSNQWPFGSQAHTQSTKLHQPGGNSIFYIFFIFLLLYTRPRSISFELFCCPAPPTPSSLFAEAFGSYLSNALIPFYVSFLGCSPSCFACHCASLPPSTRNSGRDRGVPLPLRTVLHVCFLPTVPTSATCNIAQAQRKFIEFNCQIPSQESLWRTDLKTTKVLLGSVDLHFLSLHLHHLLLALCGVPTLKPEVTSDFSPV